MRGVLMFAPRRRGVGAIPAEPQRRPGAEGWHALCAHHDIFLDEADHCRQPANEPPSLDRRRFPDGGRAQAGDAQEFNQ
eukprot:9502337-Pyramimonas_sp.AAC.1